MLCTELIHWYIFIPETKIKLLFFVNILSSCQIHVKDFPWKLTIKGWNQNQNWIFFLKYMDKIDSTRWYEDSSIVKYNKTSPYANLFMNLGIIRRLPTLVFIGVPGGTSLSSSTGRCYGASSLLVQTFVQFVFIFISRLTSIVPL